MSKVATA